jgi:hypothetical protein
VLQLVEGKIGPTTLVEEYYDTLLATFILEIKERSLSIITFELKKKYEDDNTGT